MGLFSKVQSRLLRRSTKGRLPDFFIAGAARCGTTSMWQYLRQHPDICMPEVFASKEPSFYCDLYGIRDRQVYLSIFKGCTDRQRMGEASGPYLTSPESAGRIKAEVPNAQFFIMLRNPADRAYSLYKWMHENGYERSETFEAALVEEKRRIADPSFLAGNGQYYYNFLYFESGLYAAQVKRYFDTFGRDRVMVLIFEEFVRNPLPFVQEAYRFLGVDATFKPSLELHNPSSKEIPLDGALRSRLLADYQHDITGLEKLLGRNLKDYWR